jgi:hypothetical protein
MPFCSLQLGNVECIIHNSCRSGVGLLASQVSCDRKAIYSIEFRSPIDIHFAFEMIINTKD